MNTLKSTWKAFADLGPLKVARALTIGYAAMLVALFFSHVWLYDAHGAILPNDFTAIVAAGRVTAHAATAYDWRAFHAVQVATAGHAFKELYGWLYPPPFLFVAGLLSHLPYLAAYIVWIAVTLSIYVFVVGRIAQGGAAWFLACTFPAVLMNIWAGQNGFVTAGLIGAALLSMERRPLLSGFCLGLLTFKPQLGLLFPFVLAFAGQWRVIAAATLTTLGLAIASLFAFGADAWLAFFHSIPVTAHMFLEPGHVTWGKLQSVYGLVRMLGGDDRLAWSAQISVLLATGIAVALLWRSKVPFALKAAALATASLFATPYLYIYDFPVLAVPIAFLWREEGFDRLECGVILLVCFCIFVFLSATAPLGLAAATLVAALIARRAFALGYWPRDIALQRA